MANPARLFWFIAYKLLSFIYRYLTVLSRNRAKCVKKKKKTKKKKTVLAC